MILNCSLLLTQNDKQFVKRLRNLRTADRWQLSSIKNHFEKLLSALLKSIYLNHHIITNYPYCRQVLLFSQINLIKTTLWKQLKTVWTLSCLSESVDHPSTLLTKNMSKDCRLSQGKWKASKTKANQRYRIASSLAVVLMINYLAEIIIQNHQLLKFPSC